MAVEFSWYGDADVDTATLREFVATAIDGIQQSDGSVVREGLFVTARHVAGDDVNPGTALFGFDQRFRATFRFANLADDATTDHDTALMVHAVITFAQRHGGNGVVLFNAEKNVLQYDPDGIAFASDWADWTENNEVAPLLNQFATRVLPQPLL